MSELKEHQRSAELLSDFFNIFSKIYKLEKNVNPKILYSKKSTFMGECSPFGALEHIVSRIGERHPNQKFNLIFSNQPFETFINSSSDKILNQFIETISTLENDGISFFLLPHFDFTSRKTRLLKELEENNFFINSVFQLPISFLRPETMIRPLLVSVTRVNTPVVLFAEFEGWDGNTFGQFEGLVQNLLSVFEATVISKNDTISWADPSDDLDDLWHGVYSDYDRFVNFDYWKINQEINKINSDYKDFESIKLEKICLQINTVKRGDKFEEKGKSNLYISVWGSKGGKRPVFSKRVNLEGLDHGYVQLVLNPDLVKQEYLQNYLNSKLGKLLLDSGGRFDGTNRTLSLRRIRNVEVRLPKINLQNKLSDSVIKINQIHTTVERIKSEIELNPLSSKDVDRLDDILKAINIFTIQDKIREKILIGENKKIEFKQTFSLDISTNQKEKRLEHACLKTIVAFLNTDGGTLLIGVSDQKEITGLDEEINKFHKSEDKFLLHFKNKINHYIGEKIYSFIDYALVKIDEKYVANIIVLPSDTEVFLDKDFYVRSNPSTDKLEGSKLVTYCKKRFVIKNDASSL